MSEVLHNIVLEYFLDDVEQENPTFSDPFSNSQAFNTECGTFIYDACHNTNVNDTITLNEIIDIMESLPFCECDSANDFFNTLWYERLNTYVDDEVLPNVSYNDSIWIDEIRDLIYNFCYDNFNDPDDTTSRKDAGWLLAQIYILESQMLQVNWDTNDQQALITLALLKHSANFWYEEINPDNLATSKKVVSEILLENSELKPILKWITILGYDCFFGWIGSTAAGMAWDFLDDFGYVDMWLDQFDG